MGHRKKSYQENTFQSGMVMPAFNLTTQEAEASGSEFKASPAYLLSEFLVLSELHSENLFRNQTKTQPPLLLKLDQGNLMKTQPPQH